MKGTGIKVTAEELESVKTQLSVSGMLLYNGKPMGDPAARVAELAKKYKAPNGTGLNIQTGEFCWP